MKLLKKYPMAIFLSLLIIAVSILLGYVKHAEAPAQAVLPSSGAPASLDTSLNVQQFDPFILDEANVLSGAEQREICLYNANWDQAYGAIVAVVILESLNGEDIDDLVADYADEAGLSDQDGLLLLAMQEEEFFLTEGERFLPSWSNSDFENMVEDTAPKLFSSNQTGSSILAVFSQLHSALQTTGSGGGAHRSSVLFSTIGTIVGVVSLISVCIFLMILFAILSMVDNYRYTRYHRHYGGMAVPPAIFRPILFWHRPGSRWYNRRHYRPSSPPPGGFGGGPHDDGFGGSSRGSGFSGSSRGSGFGGSSRGGSSRGSGFGGSSRGSGFGGSSRSSSSRGGSSRGGGFGKR